MIIPIILERVRKPDEDQPVIAEIETVAESKGGTISNKEKTLTELLFNTSEEDLPTLNQVLEND